MSLDQSQVQIRVLEGVKAVIITSALVHILNIHHAARSNLINEVL